MRRWLRCRSRRCSGLALLVLLTCVTLLGYGVLLALHQPLSHLELLVPAQPAVVMPDVTPPARGRTTAWIFFVPSLSGLFVAYHYVLDTALLDWVSEHAVRALAYILPFQSPDSAVSLLSYINRPHIA